MPSDTSDKEIVAAIRSATDEILGSLTDIQNELHEIKKEVSRGWGREMIFGVIVVGVLWLLGLWR